MQAILLTLFSMVSTFSILFEKNVLSHPTFMKMSFNHENIFLSWSYPPEPLSVYPSHLDIQSNWNYLLHNVRQEPRWVFFCMNIRLTQHNLFEKTKKQMIIFLSSISRVTSAISQVSIYVFLFLDHQFCAISLSLH